MRAYIQTKQPDNKGGFCCYQTEEVEIRESLLWWQEQGLSFTASGYGARIPTIYMVKYRGKWRRVYCICYSNSGTLFIGKKYNQCLTVRIDLE